ncbi:alanine racemase [Caldanaerobius fijiensis DSM 17918]|uniref:Alanine racemase n=1 Tax=Caldanaerobius fijiensis DSM 17918 TaxID=1121256 RepID=A0A1M5EEH7_9THEO|nr:alanine racemase [Caldanaerobius fijiensis]SHF77628.1 alanine racemase [Caldanaerobius fijiensis DSM 17918]
MKDFLRPVWAEVNLDNIRYNLRKVRESLNKGVEIIAVVKADAYGHGAVQVSRVLVDEGVKYLAVAILDEAIELRENGIDVPILILGYTPEDQLKYVVEYDISQTVFDLNYVRRISQEATIRHKKTKIHVKIDTGMGRIGYTDYERARQEIRQMASLPGIQVEGIFTHFAAADERDKTYTYKQYELFRNLVDDLEKEIEIPLRHVSNSAAILDLPEMELDAVRPGIILYGHYPSDEVSKSIPLRPAMSLKSKVIHVKSVEPGAYISYGRRFKTRRKSVIATVPIGYADGFTRMLTGKARVLIKGQFAPVVGTICMDQMMVDVTDVEGVRMGEEVVLFGMSGNSTLPVEEIADKLGTINYEVLCMVGKRVPRVYIGS